MIDTGIMYVLLFITLYFEVFLLVSFLENRRGRGKTMYPPHAGPLPRVAIVVPCFNEASSVQATLSSLLALDYPADKLEIIVVDDGSTDATLVVAREFESDSRVRVYRKENGGKHTAMNFALAHTNAELIGCLDADSIVEKAALRTVVPLFANKNIAAVTPGIHVYKPQTILEHLQHVEYRLSIFNRFILASLGSVFITPGPFSFFRASVVHELGGWREAHSTEDMEMALRIQTVGYLIANCPKAVVHTRAPRNLLSLFRQRVRWTYGWLRNAIDYRFMLGNRTYGNLGLFILPTALISIASGIYFFLRIFIHVVTSLIHEITRAQVTGDVGSLSFDIFYLNTSVFIFLIFMSVVLVFILICAGSFIGAERRMPPYSTPIFLLLYSFLAPLWLCTALVRAAFQTGVRWR